MHKPKDLILGIGLMGVLIILMGALVAASPPSTSLSLLTGSPPPMPQASMAHMGRGGMMGPLAATTTPTTGSGSQAAQQQVQAGQQVYSQDCSVCHGAKLEGTHEGPALGPSTLGAYGNAQSLEAFVSSKMPLTAPGSLSDIQYYQVTAYILRQAGLLPAGKALTSDDAASISLTSQTPTPPAGTPTAAQQQIQAGQQVYTQDCSRCHGPNLEGTQVGPPLNKSLLDSFATAKDLAVFNSEEMPRDQPGSLTEQQYYDVTAYILDQLGSLPAGQQLAPQDAESISLQPQTPTPASTGTAHNEVVAVKLAQVPDVGDFLTNENGYTLYYYDKDKLGESNCAGNCAKIFPPLTLPDGVHPAVGPGVPGSLGVIKRSDGTFQVTYTDQPTYTNTPLYRYYGDVEPGEVEGDQYEGQWHIISVSAGPTPTPTGSAISATIAQGNAALGVVTYLENCTSCHGIEGQGVDAPPLRNSRFVQNQGDKAVFEVIANGRPGSEMPAWLQGNGGPLGDAEIGNVVAYLHTLQRVSPLTPEPPPPPEPTPVPSPTGGPTPVPAQPSVSGGPGDAVNLSGDVEHGKPDFGKYCASCHGPEGVLGIPNPGSDDGSVPPLNPIDPTIANSDPKVFATHLDLFIQNGSIPEGPNPLLMMPAFGENKMLTQQQIADIIAYVLSLNGDK
jgi:mono/diheme cytochrome c family protein